MVEAWVTDDVLGPVTRDPANGWWQFDVDLPSGPRLHGVIMTREACPPAGCLRHIRQVVLWVRANEPQFRRRVAAGMIEYLEREYIREPGKDDVDSADTIEANIRISDATFYEEEPARVCYEARGLLSECGWTGVVVEIDAAGQFVSGPEFA